MQHGSVQEKASELRVSRWIDGNGKQMHKPLKLADLGEGYKIIFSFLHWCPGCHSRGFPTLQFLHDNLKDRDFGFAVIQTVFEGSGINTEDKLRINQQKYDLKIPFGHDVPPEGKQHPTFMEDYRTGGTPWFIVIDPVGNVVFSDFHLDAARFVAALGDGRK